MDFVKATERRCGAGLRPVGPVWRYEGRDAEEAGIGKECGHLAHATNILDPVCWREAKIGVEATPDVVAIEDIDGIAFAEEILLHRHGKRRLAGARKAGEPQHAALVSVPLLACMPRHLVADGAQIPVLARH